MLVFNCIPVRERSILIVLSVHLSVRLYLCVSAGISPQLHIQSSPIFVHATYGRVYDI